MKKFFDSRHGVALLSICLPFIIPIVVSAGISVCQQGDFEDVLSTSFFIDLLFGGGFVVSGVLLLTTKIPMEHSNKFGMGIYYGTLGLSFLVFVAFFTIGGDNTLNILHPYWVLLISLAVTSLIAYKVWLKRFKPKEDLKKQWEQKERKRIATNYARTVQCPSCQKLKGRQINSDCYWNNFPEYGDTLYTSSDQSEEYERCDTVGDIVIHVYASAKEEKEHHLKVLRLDDVRLSLKWGASQRTFTEEDFLRVYEIVSQKLHTQ